MIEEILIISTILSLTLGDSISYEDHAKEWLPKINAKESWQAGYNEFFKEKSMDQITKMMGTFLADEGEVSGINEEHKILIANTLPQAFIAGQDKWEKCSSTMGFIKDQSICGSCWAVAASEVIADRICIANYASLPDPCDGLDEKNPVIDMSAEELLSCCKFCGMGCDGGYPKQAMEYWAWNGLVTGGWFGSDCGCQPYKVQPCPHAPCADIPPNICSHYCRPGYIRSFKSDKHFADSYYALPNDSTFLMKEIWEHGPIECGFRVYENFMHYKSGVYDHEEGGMMGGHAIKVLGWGHEDGKDYWLVNNSWNTTWGINGQFKYLRGVNLGGMEANCVAGIARAKDHNYSLSC